MYTSVFVQSNALTRARALAPTRSKPAILCSAIMGIQTAATAGLVTGVFLAFGLNLTNSLTAIFSRDGEGWIDKAAQYAQGSNGGA